MPPPPERIMPFPDRNGSKSSLKDTWQECVDVRDFLQAAPVSCRPSGYSPFRLGIAFSIFEPVG
jgi:hypothetical protein